MTDRAYTDIHVSDTINVSSSGHHFGTVHFKHRGSREHRTILIEDLTVENQSDITPMRIPQYFQQEVERQLLALFRDGKPDFFEYDRDGNERRDDLRYHYDGWVTGMIRRLTERANP